MLRILVNSRPALHFLSLLLKNIEIHILLGNHPISTKEKRTFTDDETARGRNILRLL